MPYNIKSILYIISFHEDVFQASKKYFGEFSCIAKNKASAKCKSFLGLKRHLFKCHTILKIIGASISFHEDIFQASKEYFGEYSCTAKNPMGTNSANLKVSGKNN